MIKKISIILCTVTLCICMIGCGVKKTTENKKETPNATKSSTETTKNKATTNDGKNTPSKPNATSSSLAQFQPVKEGEEIAVITTNMGKIKIKLLPQYAPKAVENFKGLANKKYYNGVIFHRVMKDFMIQGGDPKGTGTGGESIWGKPFEDEFSPNIHNFRGALSMANSGSNTNGSQFFIVQNNKLTDNLLKAMEQAGAPSYSKDVISKYKEVGGTPWLDYKHTVFGQVFEGMDVVDKIASVEVDKTTSKPKKAIKINKVVIEKYKK